ncbi:E3 ubiquitin-protein ligase RING2-like [Acyrthosiphon pisum]|uniref:RING-type E3 ubiquitin transferase n=1 Tax=Acyrthosiphon pisum TaxID=7029 RepID=A0A8R2HB74_ACYPI|nr:E3 ubiquitin-protein ligase RING2-like [Acyrthosiphon pisum]|eukprot:XP_016662806.1 PREDICTED: E3 ubiquitin-protein ligase RING2-like [Acyrthosiphon pisum]
MASKNSSNNDNDEWKLSLYELQRTCHEVITDDTEIEVPLESIHKDLMCPICLELLNKTMATKCLHRFCSECIVTALRAGNKKCPTCRKRLISKRCLRPDHNIDLLISKLFPNREEFNEHRNKIIENLNQSQSHDNIVKSMTEGLKIQKQKRSYNTKNKRSAEQTKSSSSNMLAPSTSSQVDNNVTESTVQTNGTKKKKITGLDSATVTSNIIECDGAFDGVSSSDMELIFKPHPKEMHNNNQQEEDSIKADSRYIKAPYLATVAHMSRYLTIRLNLVQGRELLSDNGDVLMYISQAADQYVLLDNNLTLQNVQEKFFNAKKEKPMEIFYSYN